ncbi:MAG TPA: hypothetical protein VG225_01255 [Terracidiphilus sp.]|jgi:intracellular septation protein A|nr:hypothetical protein [Terracidiphilus sp.]
MHALALILLQDQPNVNVEQAQKIAMTMLAVMPILIIIGLAIVIIPTWFVCKKAGFSPWLSLLVIVPFGGLILLYVLAFADWKVVPAPQMAYMPPVPPYPPQA